MVWKQNKIQGQKYIEFAQAVGLIRVILLVRLVLPVNLISIVKRFWRMWQKIAPPSHNEIHHKNPFKFNNLKLQGVIFCDLNKKCSSIICFLFCSVFYFIFYSVFGCSRDYLWHISVIRFPWSVPLRWKSSGKLKTTSIWILSLFLIGQTKHYTISLNQSEFGAPNYEIVPTLKVDNWGVKLLIFTMNNQDFS